MDVVRLGPPAGESLYPSSRRKYDVVLSFIGEQGTAKVFTNKLYAALIQAGLNTFFKEEVAADAVETGGIPEFYGGIEESRASIIVFSDHFASASNSSSSESKWCSVMEELAKILECRRKIFGNLVLPVYYGVDPSQVHTSIREALYKYEGEEFKAGEEITEDESRIAIRGKRAIRWRKALEEIMALYPRRVLLNPADVLGVRQASEGVHHVPGVVEAKVENVKDVWGAFQAGSNARAVGSNKVNKLFSKRLGVRQASEGVHHVPGVVEAKVENVKDVWGDFQAGSNARAVGSNKVNKLSRYNRYL